MFSREGCAKPKSIKIKAPSTVVFIKYSRKTDG